MARILAGPAYAMTGDVPRLRIMNLAVVDDDSSVRNGLKRLLRASGHDVQLFSSAEEFLEQCVSADCVIVDVQLSGLNGIELEKRMRRLGRTTPIVFITAQANASAQDWLRRARAPCLRKPFDQSQLLDAIAEATVDQRCAQDARPLWISPDAELQAD